MFWKIYFVRVFLSLIVCVILITALSIFFHVPNLLFNWEHFYVQTALLLSILITNLITTHLYCKQKNLY